MTSGASRSAARTGCGGLNNLYTITDKERPPRDLHDELGAEALYRQMHAQNVILKARQRGFTTFIQTV